MANEAGFVGGVDSHKDTIHVAVITEIGVEVDDREFGTTAAGYRAAVAWLTGHGGLSAVGIEGTSSYGAGISAALTEAGVNVVEVNRTRPAERRKQGKSDRLDAYRAARAVLAGEASAEPKRASIEPLRALSIARRSALKAQQAAWRQIGALLITASAAIRDRYRDMPEARLVAALANTRPAAITDSDLADTLFALRSLARRHRDLREGIDQLQERCAPGSPRPTPPCWRSREWDRSSAHNWLITAGGNPDRLRSEASFAALCGAAPVPVSSGRTDRHRLSPGGDRAANSALHLIVTNRMTNDPHTRAYRDAHLDRGWSKKDIYRALKRAVAREVFQALTGRCAVPDYSDLRPARQAKNLTLSAAATHLGVWPTVISQLERGQRRNDNLANAYRAWLAAA